METSLDSVKAKVKPMMTEEVALSTKEDATKPRSRLLRHPVLLAALPFLIGGLSGMIATTCIQPIDMVKVRLQMLGEGAKAGPKANPFSVAQGIIAEGKFISLYSGLSAALLRQIVYGTARLGFFFTFEDALKSRAKKHGTEITIVERGFAALTAGGLAAIIGNPTEVALVRMQSDGLKPTKNRVNYRSAFDALARITRNEGFFALWNGATPTVIRAMSTNLGQLATFSESKHQLGKINGISNQTRTIAASTIAGFFAAFFSLPFDFVKTRLQSQPMSHNGSDLYRNMFDCFITVAKTEGVLRFYRGFGT